MTPEEEKNVQILMENTRKAMRSATKNHVFENVPSLPDSKNIIEELIRKVDPDVSKCKKCGKWFKKEHVNNHNSICHNCSPLPFTVPLMRRVFPQLISKELVSVVPMDKPEIVRGFIRKTFKRYGEKKDEGS